MIQMRFSPFSLCQFEFYATTAWQKWDKIPLIYLSCRSFFYLQLLCRSNDNDNDAKQQATIARSHSAMCKATTGTKIVGHGDENVDEDLFFYFTLFDCWTFWRYLSVEKSNFKMWRFDSCLIGGRISNTKPTRFEKLKNWEKALFFSTPRQNLSF